jgi:hypothetical protein
MPAQQDISREFQSFLSAAPTPRSPISERERDALFQQFMQWRDRQKSQGGAR